MKTKRLETSFGKGCIGVTVLTIGVTRINEFSLALTFLKWKFIKENKKVRKQENTLSTKKTIKKKRKKTRSRPRKRSRKKKKKKR